MAEVLALSAEQAERRDYLRFRDSMHSRMPAMFEALSDDEQRELDELNAVARRIEAHRVERLTMQVSGTINLDNGRQPR